MNTKRCERTLVALPLAMLVAFLAAVPLVVAAERELPLAPAQECHPRNGLPNFLRKAASPGALLVPREVARHDGLASSAR